MITYPQLGYLGRIGNQLWELASTIGIAHQLGDQAVFPADWVYRPFFSVPDELFGDCSQAQLVTDLPNVAHIHPAAKPYLQDFGLWKDIESTIRSYLAPSLAARDVLVDPAYERFFDLTMNHEVLSVHIRRGDNVPGQDPGVADKFRYHPLRPMSYYEQAIDMFPNTELVVFSDEPDWCENYFGDRAAYIHYGTTRPKEHEPEFLTAPILDWIDLFMMTHCDHHILSNSSYSWWGAFLSQDKSPVYPWPWMGTALDYIDASLMFPSTWMRIDHGHVNAAI